MIPSSRYYRESIFIHYSYVTFYACSFPHNSIHTYIMYIFRVSISMCKCSYDSILLYSYIQYSRESLMLLSNFKLLLSNRCWLDIELLLSNCYCLNLGLLVSNHYCLDLRLLLSNRYYLDIELLLSNHYYLDIVLLLPNCYYVDIELSLSNRISRNPISVGNP